jgi:hypothetical protein
VTGKAPERTPGPFWTRDRQVREVRRIEVAHRNEIVVRPLWLVRLPRVAFCRPVCGQWGIEIGHWQKDRILAESRLATCKFEHRRGHSNRTLQPVSR